MTHAFPGAQILSGQPITRVDGQLKVTGQARYASDNQIPGLVYAALVCSTVASGAIDRMETAYDPSASVPTPVTPTRRRREMAHTDRLLDAAGI